MEWQTEEDLRCPGCGQPRDKSMAPGRDDDFDVRVLQCHGCLAKAATGENRKVDSATRAAEYYVVSERT